MSLRSKIIATICAGILLLGLIGYSGWKKAHPAIVVITDRAPFTLQLNNKQYSITERQTVLRPSKGIYHYKAVLGSKDKVTLYGSVDTIQNGNEPIILYYSTFTDKAVINGLCKPPKTSDCTYRNGLQDVRYFADHSWALARFNIPGPDGTSDAEASSTIVALTLKNGKWEKVAGPFVNIGDFSGLIPDEVVAAGSR